MREEKREIKKIGIYSIATILALFGVLYGLYVGIPVAIQAGQNPVSFSEVMTYVQQYAQTNGYQAAAQITPGAILYSLGWWAIIVTPIIFAIVQFIVGIVGALIYNLFARWVGGVKIYLD